MKFIPGFEERYSADEQGNIYSHIGLQTKMLKPYDCGSPYLYVKLRGQDKKAHNYKVHRLVAMAFIPNPEGLDTVDHINGDTKDNRVENLQWMTLADNVRKARAIRVYCHKLGMYFDSIGEAAKYIDVTTGALSRAISEDRPCKGYYFVKEIDL